MINESFKAPFVVAGIDNESERKQTPPNAVEAEQALLGAILMHNEATSRISDFLRAHHFYEPVHGRIFDVALKIIDRGQVADAITLKHYFDQDNALTEIGGAQYLARLTASAVSIHAAQHYGNVIYDMALRRELIQISEEMAERAFEADIEDPAMSQLEATEQRLFTLAESGQSDSGFQGFASAVAGAVEMAQLAFKRDGSIVGVPTGLVDLDAKLGGLHKSDLLILAARPAMGKTALATNIAFHAAERALKNQEDGAVVGFFSLEMSAEQLATRILAEQAVIASDKIRRGAMGQEDFDRLVQVARQLERLSLFIDDTPALTIAGLRTRARRLKRMHGLGLIVVDYLQLMRAPEVSDNRVQEISQITRGLKALAKELDVPVLALSQLSRAVEQREDKRPQLADLRESGSIEQDADVVMFIYREDYYHERKEPEIDTAEHAKWKERAEMVHGIAEVIIGKQRHGPTGTVRLQFDRDYTRFRNLDVQHNPHYADH